MDRKTYEGWHFLAKKGKLRGGSPAAEVGGVETYGGDLVICESGLHACARAIDALKYAPGPIVRRVRLSGAICDGDKAVAAKREILGEADVTRELHEFACWCAESVIHLIPEARREPAVNAIATKRRWLDGKATDNILDAAKTAAWAAEAARQAASEASWDAASEAASEAARAAANEASWNAEAASEAARQAAWDAARAEQNAVLERVLMEAMS